MNDFHKQYGDITKINNKAVQICSEVYTVKFDQYSHFNLQELHIASKNFINAYVVNKKENIFLQQYSFDSTVMFAIENGANKSYDLQISYWKLIK